MDSPGRLPYLAGTASADITPPMEVGLLMSSVEQRWAPFEGVRLPLLARALFLSGAHAQIALVSLDLLGLDDAAVGGMRQFKARIAAAANGVVSADALILASTHTHTAPESAALTDLYLTQPFKGWLELLIRRTGEAVRLAAQGAVAARLALGRSTAPGTCIHRRIKTTRGVLLSHPAPPPEILLPGSAPVDETVNVAMFLDRQSRPVCLVVNAACHPVHEMCIPFVSPDYPGEVCRMLAEEHGCGVLFLNGTAGNLNPPTVSGGATAAREHALRIVDAARRAMSDPRASQGEDLLLSRRAALLPARDARGGPRASAVSARVALLQVGDAGFVLLPGEPFVETGLALRAHSPFKMTFLVGGADAYIGYIPTDEAFAEGGYETGPGRWSRLAPGSEPALREVCVQLLRQAANASAKPRLEAAT